MVLFPTMTAHMPGVNWKNCFLCSCSRPDPFAFCLCGVRARFCLRFCLFLWIRTQFSLRFCLCWVRAWFSLRLCLCGVWARFSLRSCFPGVGPRPASGSVYVCGSGPGSPSGSVGSVLGPGPALGSVCVSGPGSPAGSVCLWGQGWFWPASGVGVAHLDSAAAVEGVPSGPHGETQGTVRP